LSFTNAKNGNFVLLGGKNLPKALGGFEYEFFGFSKNQFFLWVWFLLGKIDMSKNMQFFASKSQSNQGQK
jgi:hypothetical protein